MKPTTETADTKTSHTISKLLGRFSRRHGKSGDREGKEYTNHQSDTDHGGRKTTPRAGEASGRLPNQAP